MTAEQLLDELKATLEKKGHDYGKGGTDRFFNFHFSANFAAHFQSPIDKVFATMLGVKLARLISLQNRSAINESIEDTYRDAIGYLALWQEWNSVELAMNFKSPTPIMQNTSPRQAGIITGIGEQEAKDYEPETDFTLP